MTGEVKVGRSGARTVELLMPFEYVGATIAEVAIGPFLLDHTMRWKEAEYKNWLALMVEVSTINGEQATEEKIRLLRYPDVDRVVRVFLEVLPAEIRSAVVDGTWPKRERLDGEPAATDEMPMTEDEQPKTDGHMALGGTEFVPADGPQPDVMDLDN